MVNTRSTADASLNHPVNEGSSNVASPREIVNTTSPPIDDGRVTTNFTQVMGPGPVMNSYKDVNYRGPKLNMSNYTTWSFCMRNHLMAMGTWKYIENNQEPDYQNAKARCFADITQSLEDDQIMTIIECDTPAEAWELLRREHRTASTANVIFLKQDMNSKTWNGTQDLKSYIEEMKEMSLRLKAVGHPVQEHDLCMMILIGIKEQEFSNTIATLTIGKTEPLQFDAVRAALLLTDMSIKRKNPKANEEHGFFVGQKPRGSRITHMNPAKGQKCFNCNKLGHFARDCRRAKTSRQPEFARKVTKDRKKVEFAFTGRVETNNDQQPEQTTSILPHNYMIVDSGATTHLIGNQGLLHDAVKINEVRVIMADGRYSSSTISGSLYVQGDHDEKIRLDNVLYVKDLQGGLFSVRAACDRGIEKVEFSANDCKIRIQGKTLITGMRKDQHYVIPLKPVPLINSEHAMATQNDHLIRWHERLGHLNINDVAKMANENIVNGLNVPKQSAIRGSKHVCKACALEKAIQMPLSKKESSSVSSIGDMIYSDIAGPFAQSGRGKRYYVIFIDKKSRYTWIYFMRNRGELLDRLKGFLTEFRFETGRDIKAMRSDNEYLTKDIEKFMIDNNIFQQTTSPYSPHQNGIAERMNRTIKEMSRTCLTHASLPMTFWEEATRTSVYIRNRCITKALKDNKTPFEKLHNIKPDLSKLKTFGCRVFVTLPTGMRSKQMSRAKEGIFVGYELEKGAYRIVRIDTRKLTISRCVTFDEEILGFDSRPHMLQVPEPINPSVKDNFMECPENPMNDNNITESNDEIMNIQSKSPLQKEENDIVHKSQVSESIDNDLTSLPGGGNSIDNDMNQEDNDVSIEANDPETTNRRTTRRKITPLPFHHEFGYAATTNVDEPKTYAEALQSTDHEKWVEAMKEEMNSLEENETWTVTDLPPGRRAIGSKWVFKKKKDETGQVRKYKARLVAQGFSQQPGVDFENTYAPVVSTATLRALLSFAATNDWVIQHDDVTSAYLNGNITEEIYLKQPRGFEINKHQVCRLKKSIYGLKQSGREWWIVLSKILESIGFLPAQSDRCLFILRKDKKVVMIATYVDDLLITGNDENLIESSRKTLNSHFKMKTMGNVSWLLGIRIRRDLHKKTITLTQESYIDDLLSKFNMTECNPAKTPAITTTVLKMAKFQQIESSTEYPFRELVGALLFIARMTRPDILTATTMTARYCQNPNEEHVTAAKRILRYLKGTRTMGIVLGGTKTPKIEIYADASYASDVDDRKSTTGYIVLYNGPIDFMCKKQATVATSTTEAEINALDTATKIGMWTRQLIEDISGTSIGLTQIWEDNQAAIAIVNGRTGSKSRTKHYDVKVRFIQEQLNPETKKFVLSYCPTENMIADFLTKTVTASRMKAMTDVIMRFSIQKT